MLLSFCQLKKLNIKTRLSLLSDVKLIKTSAHWHRVCHMIFCTLISSNDLFGFWTNSSVPWLSGLAQSFWCTRPLQIGLIALCLPPVLWEERLKSPAGWLSSELQAVTLPTVPAWGWVIPQEERAAQKAK